MKVRMDLETGTRAVQPTPASNENLKLCRGEIEAINANLASCDELARDGFLEGNECAELKSKLMKELDAVKSKYGIKNVPVESQQQSCQPQAPVTQPPLKPKPIDTFSEDPFAALHVLQEVSTNATLKSLHGLRSPKISSPHARMIFAEDKKEKKPVRKKRARNTAKKEVSEVSSRPKRRRCKIPAYAEDCAEILESEQQTKLSKDGTNRRGRQCRTTHSLKSKLAVIAVYDDTVKARGGKDRGVKRFVANILNLSETMIGRWINERDRIKAAYEKSVARGRNHKNCVTKLRKEPAAKKQAKRRSSTRATEAI